MSTRSCIWAFLPCYLTSLLCAGDLSPGLLLEQASLRSLEAISQASMLITIRSAASQSLESANGQEERIELAVEYSDHQIRVRRSAHTNVDSNPVTTVTERIYGQDFLAVVEPDRVQLVQGADQVQIKREEVFDPRLLATCASDMFILDQFESVGHPCIAWEDRRNETVVDEVLDGVSVKHVSYERVNGTRFDLWIAPSQGHAILKAQVGDDKFTAIAIRRFREVDGIWFPEHIRTTQRFKDKVVVDQEAVIERISFQPIDPRRFDLASLDLRPGTVVWHAGGDRVWTGTELVDLRTLPRPDASMPSTRNYVRWLLLINAFLCTLIAVIVLFHRRRQRKPPQHPVESP